MQPNLSFPDFSSCGVGFVASLRRIHSNQYLKQGLIALKNMEHRGGSDKDLCLGDGAGIMTSIPYELLGVEPQKVAIATLFAPTNPEKLKTSLKIFEETFEAYGLKVFKYRDVPTRPEVLSPLAQKNMPTILHAFIARPEHCRTLASFDNLMYLAKQMVRTRQKQGGIYKEFFFTSLSSSTIIYKALCTSAQLEEFYPDLKSNIFKTSFVVLHRRFSTNTLSSWDKVQPFRLIAHNGEINTIEGNLSGAISREKALGLREDELITHSGTSDSGNLNGMVEALKYRSSIPHLAEILAIMVPPAQSQEIPYFQFWSRAMEPWDGPALITFCDGKRIGARLDRNGFRPGRWIKTEYCFYLASEVGAFEIPAEEIESQGALLAGRSVSIHLFNGDISFTQPHKSAKYKEAVFDPRLTPLEFQSSTQQVNLTENYNLFYTSKEDVEKILIPMAKDGKNPIGSMGDTAAPAFLSNENRSLFDYFYQNFAQVTNPPLDYLREKMVTDLRAYLGRKPNIFEPKELIPPPRAYMLDGPILGLGQMEFLYNLEKTPANGGPRVVSFALAFSKKNGYQGLVSAIDELVENVIFEVQNGLNIIILSDRNCSSDMLPIPSLLALRAIQIELNRSGRRLRVSIVIDSGEIKTAHHASVLIGFGASALCPYMALDFVRRHSSKELESLFPDEREKNLISALTSGILKIMAKRGISVLRSYQGAELFTILGIGKEISERFFPHHPSLVGGLDFEKLYNNILKRSEQNSKEILEKPPHLFLFKEHASSKMGEQHSMTAKLSKMAHEMVRTSDHQTSWELYQGFKSSAETNLVNLRGLLEIKENPIPIDEVEKEDEILKTFGQGAMSFGAISSRAQRDLFVAFNAIGGRSNSGEGGENPYYYTEGISAKVKQIASGRFGVTAEYLVTGDEIQVKIAQGAKPGEGGQLMGKKVSPEIAKARFSTPGTDLISPPPQHDIYSIEDLKELIFELKELSPHSKISIKLVSGKNIGAIAIGVAKAGADIIHVSGGDGGTGAADLLSMKHAGLPFEIGLLEVHHALVSSNLRDQIILRADGGLVTGRDVAMAAILGAQEFDFGKMTLIAEGCIMARVCEKNTCPTGIATHDPQFLNKYQGSPEHVINYLRLVAKDVRQILAETGHRTLLSLVGQTSKLYPNPKFEKIINEKKVNLEYFFGQENFLVSKPNQKNHTPSKINQEILKHLTNDNKLQIHLNVKTTDRAVGATVSGALALKKSASRKTGTLQKPEKHKFQINLEGNAGQGLGVFLEEELYLRLEGDANDSVGKGLCGGKIVICPSTKSRFDPTKSVLVGNASLYGATSGTLYIYGRAGDRFAVRNSGAHAVVEGVGLHACEYMTGGKILILGSVHHNMAAGMTGGTVYLLRKWSHMVNQEYVKKVPLLEDDKQFLKDILIDYLKETESQTAKNILVDLNAFFGELEKYIPH